jgi:hypothetical protein
MLLNSWTLSFIFMPFFSVIVRLSYWEHHNALSRAGALRCRRSADAGGRVVRLHLAGVRHMRAHSHVVTMTCAYVRGRMCEDSHEQGTTTRKGQPKKLSQLFLAGRDPTLTQPRKA